MKPEYIALFISVIAVCVNVYISWKNRKYALAKEEYFKLKQITERIISKLLILDNHREKFRIYFESSFEANKIGGNLIDSNDTFNKTDFEKDSEEIAALIEIYFNELAVDWNFCLERMSELLTLIARLDNKIKNKEQIDWKNEQDNFNKILKLLGNKPREIGDKVKNNLFKFKDINL